MMFPVPDAPQDAPLDAEHVHVALFSVLGNVSVTLAAITFDGPLFLATTV